VLRFLSYVVAVAIGAIVAAGGVALASDHANTTSPALTARVAKLERDNVALKAGMRNICGWFKHPPQVESSEWGLKTWLEDVGLGCPTVFP